ncbi:hypothetical protein MKZ38_009979 [Zalerion maritima]|uniref:CFEM domain-containing protein n=1 Tax=Zalerion maritima TaxID=339359 RepID=A0AAD5WSR2_9PEZI|nr:hypothetical protein MKZ38_009979 [Zalerion maritima]
MKTTAFIAGAFATAASAQLGNGTFPDDFPTCGETCIKDMYQGGDPQITTCDAEDLECLCGTPEFAYGVRDCTYAACGDAPDIAPSIFEVAIEICQEQGVDITESINKPADGSEDEGSGDDSDGSDGGDDSNVGGAVGVTSVVVSTSVDGDSTSIMTMTTVFSGVPTATTEVATTDSDGNDVTSTQVMYSTITGASSSSGSGTGSSGSSSTGSADGSSTTGDGDSSGGDSDSSSGDGGDDSSSTGDSDSDSTGSSSDNYGPAITAAPGLAAAAGLAVLLL